MIIIIKIFRSGGKGKRFPSVTIQTPIEKSGKRHVYGEDESG